MSEHKDRSKNRVNKRSNFIFNWVNRDHLSANNRERQSNFTHYFYNHGRDARNNQSNLTITWYHYRISIILASAATFGIGFAQCITKIAGAG